MRHVMWQAAAFALAGLLIFLTLQATSASLSQKGVATGFGFLEQIARIPVTNASIPFEDGVDTYARALMVGAVNTIKIAAAGIALATVIGIFVGAGGLSSNPLVRWLCSAYVDLMRNVPVLLHITIWYMVFLSLPGPREAINIGDWLMISNRGIFLPGWLVEDGNWVFKMPSVEGFNIVSGISISPEYGALAIGIGMYTAAFVAEIFRGSIQAIPNGQWEAGQAIGLHRRKVFWRIVFPQSTRVAIPPLTSEYLGALKNSSLAVAIGYQDLVGVGNSVLFETGQAIEVISLTVLFYIVISLIVSLLMEVVNRRFALKER
ncbi:MAG: ABC transporter permease subunit [Hydrogenophaga sp.]|uniref:ABC transporter permease subunit n=1 Tax=Hydrogenophaga sp. TaxID=1904254 RepID=UPI002635D90F|nr:ABC transporter permease subunit [Hydrogenophaga sp.]MCV0437455.1 ABC transporter permease subunit [Hydrogenophaga sp.]